MSDALAFLAFGPRGEGLLCVRASGAIDAMEFDPVADAYVEGTNRDGGLPMPEGWWETGRMAGAIRRLTRIDCEREGFSPLAFVAYTERVPSGETSTALPGRRWTRVSPRVQGRTHRVRIRIPETVAGVASAEMAFDVTDGPDK